MNKHIILRVLLFFYLSLGVSSTPGFTASTLHEPWHEIHHAITQNNCAQVQKIMEEHADNIPAVKRLFEQQDEKGRSALHLFAISSFSDASVWHFLWGALKNYPLQFDVYDQVGLTPLQVAIRFNHVTCAKAYIEAGACVDSCDKRGFSTLDHLMVENVSSDTILTLAPFFKHVRGQKQQNILSLALFNTRMDVAKGLVTLYQTDEPFCRSVLEDCDTDGNTPLHIVSKFDGDTYDADFVTTCLTCNPTLDIQNIVGWTPLYTAVLYQNSAYVQALINKGASTGRSETKGNVPLHLSILMLQKKSEASIKIAQILARKTDVFHVNEQGMTAYDLLMYLWAHDQIDDETKSRVEHLFNTEMERKKEQLKHNSKRRIFYHTFTSVLKAYFNQRRQEICGEIPPQRNMICFSNAINAVSNALSFSGANVIGMVASSAVGSVEDHLYLKRTTDNVKGFDGLQQMEYEVDKLGYVLLHHYSSPLGALTEHGIKSFAQYAANRIKKYINRGLYHADQTLTAQLLTHFKNMPRTLSTCSHALKVSFVGEAYLDSTHITARQVLSDQPSSDEQDG